MQLHELTPSLWPQVGIIKSYFPKLKENGSRDHAVGTVTLINPGAVLTAAHNIHDRRPERGGAALKFDILFGGGILIRGIPGGNARVLKEWRDTGPSSTPSPFDAGVILLGTRVDGPAPAEIRATRSSDLVNFSANVVGYPVALPGGRSTLQGAADFAFNDLEPPLGEYTIQYPIPTLGGMSGGPVYRTDELSRGIVIRAVHTNGLDNKGSGIGLMISPKLDAQIQIWAAQGTL